MNNKQAMPCGGKQGRPFVHYTMDSVNDEGMYTMSRSCQMCHVHHKKCEGGRPCERCFQKGYTCNNIVKKKSSRRRVSSNTTNMQSVVQTSNDKPSTEKLSLPSDPAPINTLVSSRVTVPRNFKISNSSYTPHVRYTPYRVDCATSRPQPITFGGMTNILSAVSDAISSNREKSYSKEELPNDETKHIEGSNACLPTHNEIVKNMFDFMESGFAMLQERNSMN
ncbi:hypothetical protein AKO1_007011 [Acrasis kona]|uniref:Zn(2)-C6 fungal-type domain-containing protein n=1 Tax=Acrasis kona TaxID=1008807 RepID=A0AAW2YV65_9EUKA